MEQEPVFEMTYLEKLNNLIVNIKEIFDDDWEYHINCVNGQLVDILQEHFDDRLEISEAESVFRERLHAIATHFRDLNTDLENVLCEARKELDRVYKDGPECLANVSVYIQGQLDSCGDPAVAGVLQGALNLINPDSDRIKRDSEQ